jgi:hypothetical protein
MKCRRCAATSFCVSGSLWSPACGFRFHWFSRKEVLLGILVAAAVLMFGGWLAWAAVKESEKPRPRTGEVITLDRPLDGAAFLQRVGADTCEAGIEQQAAWYHDGIRYPVPTAWVTMTVSPAVMGLKMALAEWAVMRGSI